jgi:hypothetical protein
MKRTALLKTTLGLLAIAAAGLPLSARAGSDMSQSMTAYGEDAFYVNLSHIQPSPSAPAPAGMQGPLRSDGMSPTWSYGEGALYDNLRNIQSAPSTPAQARAQDSMRNDGAKRTYFLGNGPF